jgi:cobalt-zinc-cadmium efflux system membrane fusion protein
MRRNGWRAWTVAVALLAGCRAGGEPADTGTALSPTSVTIWTDSTELFMEHPVLFTETPNRFAVHLTDLTDFSPLRSGRVTLRAVPQAGGEAIEVIQEEPRSPGIFGLELIFPAGGVWDLSIAVESPQASDRIEVPGLVVLDDLSDGEVPPGPAEGEISFLKEQQWKTPGFATSFAISGSLATAIEVPGEIVAAANRLARVTAPAAGLLDGDGLAGTPLVGEPVTQGTVLLRLLPALGDAGSTMADAQAELLEAEAEAVRARRLVEAEAAPRRRLVEAEVALERARQMMAGLGQGLQDGRLPVRAPIGGIVAERPAVAGERVAPGDPLVVIVDPSVLWLRARIPVGQAEAARATGPAAFRLEGETAWRTSGHRLPSSPLIDSLSRTLPVFWEVANARGEIAIGATATVSIPLSGGVDGLVVPASAILEEDGIPVIYVQVTGESFSRRPVQVGARTAGRAVIIGGLQPADRVVSGAGYQVRLASLGGAVPAHGHEH